MFKAVDAFYLAMMAVPIVCAIALNVLTKPAAEGISITGARIFFTVPMPLQNLPVTEAQVNSLAVVIAIFFFCLFMTHGINKGMKLTRFYIAEWAVEKVDSMVNENMGEYFKGYSPFVISIMLLSAFSSLLSLFGLFPPTSDINIIGGWAALVFFLITYYKMKCGPLYYLKGFTEPIVLLAPINIISEFATPVSMSFRHYGNVLSGTVISTLLAFFLGSASAKVLGSLPGFLADFPIFQVGIPAVLSLYFDLFSSLLQAFIFSMLTMLNVSGAFPMEEYFKRKEKKQKKKAKAK